MTTETRRDQERPTADQSFALWEQYKASGDISLRNRLVLTYVPLVKHIVYKKLRELPASCEVDDLISCGIETLIGAIDRYDPSKGASLEPYLWLCPGRASSARLGSTLAAPDGARPQAGTRVVHRRARPPAQP